MALKIHPLQVPAPSNELTFCSHPFLSATELWEEGINLFHHWALHHFEAGKIYGTFELAEKLNVHRLISDDWWRGLLYSGSSGIFKHTELRATAHLITYGANEAHGFSLKPVKKLIDVEFDLAGLDEYDPWVDRTLDEEIPDAIYADLVIDKFYSVLDNEYFVVKHKSRVRDNGTVFVPLEMSEHPRYADDPPKTGMFEERWQASIESTLARKADE